MDTVAPISPEALKQALRPHLFPDQEDGELKTYAVLDGASVEPGPLDEAADARARGLDPAELRCPLGELSRTLPVEVERDVGPGQQRRPLRLLGRDSSGFRPPWSLR